MSVYSYYDDVHTAYNPTAPAQTTLPMKKQRSSQRKYAPIVFCVLQFIILLFSILGICFDQYKTTKLLDEYGIGCISYWSVKEPGQNCISGKSMGASPAVLTALCKKREGMFKAGAGSGVTAVVLVFFGLVVGCLVAFTHAHDLRFVCVGINVLAFIFLCVAWALIASMYNKGEETQPDVLDMMRRLDITESTDGLGLNVYLPALCGAFKDLNNMQEAKEMGQKAIGYGSGFALLIVAWVLVIINSIVALLPF